MRGSVPVHINAPADRIWRLISDVTQIGRYSPETFEAEWLYAAAEGARFRTVMQSWNLGVAGARVLRGGVNLHCTVSGCLSLIPGWRTEEGPLLVILTPHQDQRSKGPSTFVPRRLTT
jgi:hypothetical protein